MYIFSPYLTETLAWVWVDVVSAETVCRTWVWGAWIWYNNWGLTVGTGPASVANTAITEIGSWLAKTVLTWVVVAASDVLLRTIQKLVYVMIFDFDLIQKWNKINVSLKEKQPGMHMQIDLRSMEFSYLAIYFNLTTVVFFFFTIFKFANKKTQNKETKTAKLKNAVLK